MRRIFIWCLCFWPTSKTDFQSLLADPWGPKKSPGLIVRPRGVTDGALGHSVCWKHLLPTCNEFAAHEGNGKKETVGPGGENDLIFKSWAMWLYLKISHRFRSLTRGMGSESQLKCVELMRFGPLWTWCIRWNFLLLYLSIVSAG